MTSSLKGKRPRPLGDQAMTPEHCRWCRDTRHLQLGGADNLCESRCAATEPSVERHEAAPKDPRKSNVLGVVRFRPPELARKHCGFFVQTPWGAALDPRVEQSIQRALRLLGAETVTPYKLTKHRRRFGPEKCRSDWRVPHELLKPTWHQGGVHGHGRVENDHVTISARPADREGLRRSRCSGARSRARPPQRTGSQGPPRL